MFDNVHKDPPHIKLCHHSRTGGNGEWTKHLSHSWGGGLSYVMAVILSLIVNADLEELLFTTLQPWETLVQWH